ncbi:MAG TPA: DUF5130 family protein [Candidatus Limnocylindria bacterium]|nr:DUF5130 family protein [Candidatus Limnocylindria bacterium]
MPAGEAFSARQSDRIDRAVRQAHEESGLSFSVFVGDLGADARPAARGLHASLGDRADTSVLVAVDPGARRLEVVTGSVAHRALDDRSCALAALTMTSQFAMGDLPGGIVNGLRTLAEHARHPRTLHLDQP